MFRPENTTRRSPRILDDLATGLAVSAMCLLVAGCGADVEPLGEGSFEVTWDVSPHGCESAGVEVVELHLINAHREYIEQFECDRSAAELDQVSPAKYDLRLVGLDPSGHATFESQSTVVRVDADRLNQVDTVRLTAKPADLRVAWTFENARVCGANGVDRVEVALFDAAYYEVARRAFECDSGGGVIEGLRAGTYTVEASAETDTESAFHGITETSLKRGDNGYADIVLE